MRDIIEEVIRLKLNPPMDDVGFIADQVESVIDVAKEQDDRFLRQMTVVDVALASMIRSLGIKKENGCICQDCGKTYKIDLMIDDDMWNKIKPASKPEGSGLLCGSCILMFMEAFEEYGAYELKEL